MKQSRKESAQNKAKKAVRKELWLNAAVVAAVLAIFLAFGLFLNLGTVGKAITKPSPPVDLSLQSSESLDLSAYNKMEVDLAFSGEEDLSKVLLDAILQDGLVYYKLVQQDPDTEEDIVVAYGILSQSLANSGAIYLNDDNVGDVELRLTGSILTMHNLNFVQPDVADVEIYDANFNKLIDDVIIVDKDEEIELYINVSSTALPEVNVSIDGQPADVEEADSGNDFVLLKLTFTGTEDKPSQLRVTADVGGQETTKTFILAVSGYVYELQQQGYSVRLRKVGSMYQAIYVLQKTQKLQPVALLCGELDFAANSEQRQSIKKILSYDADVEQWKENVPSEFETLVTGRGYLVELNSDTLTFTIPCAGKPLPELPLLDIGWNLVGINGYKPTRVQDIQVPTGEITGIYVYENNQALQLTELQPGMVYWLKVE